MAHSDRFRVVGSPIPKVNSGINNYTDRTAAPGCENKKLPFIDSKYIKLTRPLNFFASPKVNALILPLVDDARRNRGAFKNRIRKFTAHRYRNSAHRSLTREEFARKETLLRDVITYASNRWMTSRRLLVGRSHATSSFSSTSRVCACICFFAIHVSMHKYVCMRL